MIAAIGCMVGTMGSMIAAKGCMVGAIGSMIAAIGCMVGAIAYSYGPSRLRCPRLWLRTIAGKSTCGRSVAFPWEAHPKGGNYDGV